MKSAAKNTRGKSEDSFEKHLGNSATEIDLDNVQWEQVNEQKPQYHNFDKENPLFCKFLSDNYEVGEYKAFLIMNIKTGKEELLPDQMAINEAYEKAGKNSIFRIEFLGRVKIKNSKREFASYDIKMSN